MRSFLSWIGGKSELSNAIVAHFPPDYKTYAEVFCGAAWVFFKKRRSPREFLNDMNGNLANLYWQVQEHCDQLIDRMKFSIDSEDNFKRMKLALDRCDPMDDLTRAAWFYQVIRYSYGSKGDTYGGQCHDIRRDFPTIESAYHRLRGVSVHNKDFEHFIKVVDRPDTLLYCDPPYWGTESYYKGVTFGTEGHQRLFDTLMNIQGFFLLSYNDCPEIRELYGVNGIFIKEILRLNNLKQCVEAGSEYPEVLIANYDISKLGGFVPQQIGLWH